MGLEKAAFKTLMLKSSFFYVFVQQFILVRLFIFYILHSRWPGDFCLFLFSPCRVTNARRSFGYACALCLAGQKNKFAKISPFHPE
jgi:hypothetical protein